MRFVNRTSELARLAEWRADPSSRLAVVWGRRRVGKTALINEFAPEGATIYHTGAARGAAAELALLSRAADPLVRGTSSRDLLTRPFADWDDAFDTLASAAERFPTLLVLDEFPELADSSPGLPNVMRAFLDRVQERSTLKILLAGSAVRYMSELGEERNPLYGRVGLSLQVHPFAPHEAAMMLPDLSPSDRAVVHGLVGGTPLYLSWWDQDADLAANLARLACRPAARLLTEGDLVLATEVESGDFPAAVLQAIAGGRTRYNEIEAVVGADPTRTLQRLISLRLVERVLPVTESGRTRRRVYRISDNFLRFYLNVLSPYRTHIERGLGETILPAMIESLDDNLGLPWEESIRAHLYRVAPSGVLGEQVVAIGPWWNQDSTVELDAVVLSGRRRIPVAVAEAKWARSVDGRRLSRQLASRAERVPDMVDEPRLVLAARESVTDAPHDALVLTAADVFDN